jgi:hypothetical protein
MINILINKITKIELGSYFVERIFQILSERGAGCGTSSFFVLHTSFFRIAIG